MVASGQLFVQPARDEWLCSRKMANGARVLIMDISSVVGCVNFDMTNITAIYNVATVIIGEIKKVCKKLIARLYVINMVQIFLKS